MSWFILTTAYCDTWIQTMQLTAVSLGAPSQDSKLVECQLVDLSFYLLWLVWMSKFRMLVCSESLHPASELKIAEAKESQKLFLLYDSEIPGANMFGMASKGRNKPWFCTNRNKLGLSEKRREIQPTNKPVSFSSGLLWYLKEPLYFWTLVSRTAYVCHSFSLWSFFFPWRFPS